MTAGILPFALRVAALARRVQHRSRRSFELPQEWKDLALARSSDKTASDFGGLALHCQRDAASLPVSMAGASQRTRRASISRDCAFMSSA